ncbi:ATP-grasp domain-containing protein [Ornithinimicrobium sp. W1665]|uniref:ATP-grasp domain-containing protein n=1 Tax=Ornithinimicrobium sp. W1665 TaxID=3416666 RepID=UPI003CF53C69
MPPSPGAVLVLAHVRDRAAVTVARALRRQGWRVGAGTPRASAGFVGASRAVSATHVVPRARGTLGEFVRAVTAAVEAEGYDLVVGAGDDWMAALSHVADRLPVPVAAPSRAVVEQALDKLGLVEAAGAAGLAAPHTWIPSDDVDPGSVPLPVVVKSRTHWRPGVTRRHRVEVELCHDADALAGQLARIRAHGDEPVLQQPVHGRLGALVGVVHEGRLIGRVQQVAPRLWPTPHGASARAVTVPVDAELARRSEDLLRRIGWVGLVELQFLTGKDGTPWLIDFNGRPFGSVALAESARPGLLDAWVRGALDLPVPDLADGRVGVRYQWLAGDLRRARIERRGGLARDVGNSLRWAVGARHSLTRLDDPGPVAHLLTARFRPDDPDPDHDEDASRGTPRSTPPLAS